MAILLKSGLIFLHIPKTGGTWVKKVLYENDLVKLDFSDDHADMERVLNYPRHFVGNAIKDVLKYGPSIIDQINASQKFCFVRNPYDWYESYWRYMCGLNWKKWEIKQNNSRFRHDWHPLPEFEGIQSNDFNEFVLAMINNEPGYVTKMYNWYVTNKTTYVGMQENLTNDLIMFLKRTGAKFDEERIKSMEKENVSAKVNIVWDEDLKNEIYKLEYPTFKKYGYSR